MRQTDRITSKAVEGELTLFESIHTSILTGVSHQFYRYIRTLGKLPEMHNNNSSNLESVS